MKMSLFTRFFSRHPKPHSERGGSLSPEDIRRKLKDYRKTDGRADFGSAQLYRVEEDSLEGGQAPKHESH